MLTIRQKIVNELKSEVNWKTFEVGVFSRGVPINQFQVLFTSCIDICLGCITSCIDICLSCYTLFLCYHLFTSCYTLSFVYKLLHVVFVLPFVYKLLHVFTMSFKFMYHHVRKSRSEMT